MWVKYFDKNCAQNLMRILDFINDFQVDKM